VKRKVKIIGLFLIIFLFSLNAKAAVFPLEGGTPDDFSSPFGPRCLNNSYDFHEWLDIGNVNVRNYVYCYVYCIVYLDIHRQI